MGAVVDVDVAPAHADALDLDQHLPGPGLGAGHCLERNGPGGGHDLLKHCFTHFESFPSVRRWSGRNSPGQRRRDSKRGTRFVYSFTAPAVRPPTMYFWRKMNISTTGRTRMEP